MIAGVNSALLVVLVEVEEGEPEGNGRPRALIGGVRCKDGETLIVGVADTSVSSVCAPGTSSSASRVQIASDD
jgi:hypothetical protein